jgi:hypothetical protein
VTKPLVDKGTFKKNWDCPKLALSIDAVPDEILENPEAMTFLDV